MNKVLFSSKSDLWKTPESIFNELNYEFKFDLDPCTSDNNLGLKYYFTEKDDGLSQSWSDRIVFCNPPYSKISKWIEKGCYEYLNNNATVVFLIPARTDTKWFHNYILPWASEIRFIKGRLKFNGSKYNASFPSMICVFKKVYL